MVTVDNKTSSVLNRSFSKATDNVKSTLLELSSGKRINKASDDPASAAIVEQLAAEISTGAAALRNISDGVSAIQIADGAASTVSDLNIRLKELAVQASSGSLSDTQRAALDAEFQSTLSEINRTEGQATFNGVQLFGSSTNLQTGTSSNTNSQTALNISNVNTSALGLNGLSIATQGGALAAIDATENSSEIISSVRADLGAVESRLSTSFENLKTSIVNNESAKSTLADADIASAAAKNVAAKISQQGAASLFAINNQSQANVIKALLT